MNADTELDCLTCGACCRQASDGRILVPALDILRWKRNGRLDLVAALVPGHFSELAFASTAEGACVHLGTPSNAHACRIYEDRGTTCRDFEKGSWQCLEFRREAGIDPPLLGTRTDPGGKRSQ
jgi:Fe-S-cluster containining protein